MEKQGFLTSAGHPIAHECLVSKLWQAIQLPSALSVIHCKAHQKDDSLITRGNQYVDSTTKWMTTQHITPRTIVPVVQTRTEIPYKNIFGEGGGRTV